MAAGSVLRQVAGRLAKPLLVGALILGVGSPADAQYFGRNKVRYRNFDFRVLKTEHFDIYFYSSERKGVDIAARLAERWHARFEELFRHELSGRQPLVLYASHADFEQTNVIPEELDESTGGVTEPLRRRIILPLAGPLGDTDHVLGHEIVHAFQFDATRSAGPSGEPGALRLPLWFIEGMAEYLSLGSIDANTAMKLRDAMQRERLPSIRSLQSAAYFPYQWGHALLAYIGGRYGDAAIPALLRAAAASGDMESAFFEVLGVDIDELSKNWHDAIRASYASIIAGATPLADAEPLNRAHAFGGDLNVGPALSPDGRWIAFLSSRGLFSIDMYVADVATGKVARKLTSTASDRHFSSIEFINSAGAWDPASERIAMATVVSGRAALAIFSRAAGKRDREIALPDLDEIFNPAWAPDGHAIAFTGMRQGLTDLFVYDLAASRLDQITDDAFADLHPAWSPDSRRIVFATDRFSSDLESLQIGPLQLGVVDAKSRTIERIAALSHGKHISPQWAPDGASVYFVGEPGGVPNVYRVMVATGALAQLTMLATGVSGITPTSPALSVSAATGRLALTVYEGDGYNIYIKDADEVAWPADTLPLGADTLPPGDRQPGALMGLLADPAKGLPNEQRYPAVPYKPSLGLAGFAQPTAGVGVGSFGAGVSGGAAVVFADTLGDHLLATAVQLNSGVTDSFTLKGLSFQAEYVNRSRRWNWGVAGSQVPYLRSIASVATASTATGEVLELGREIARRQIERNVSGILAYPFDRSRRIEFRGGITQTSFEQTLTTTTTSRNTGDVEYTSTSQDFAPRLNLATSAAAIVLDNAQFGPISPIKGERYRLEVSPAIGSINYTGILVDYRRYVMPLPFYTIAGRVLHYARYGEGGDDLRLYPIYLDNPSLVRGYHSYGDTLDCPAIEIADCRRQDNMIGSRVLVGNLELRFPLLRPFGVSRSMYGPLPMEVALFADSGVAWTSHDRPAMFGGSRTAIASTGVALRIGFGPFAGEIDAVRPLQQPGRGWVFGFNLIPGW